MFEDHCVLTPRDFAMLEVMLDRCLGRDDPMRPLLELKLEGARIVSRDDVGDDIATLGSRVSFSVDNREADVRVLSHSGTTAPVGLGLPITTVRGLALMGLREGQALALPGRERTVERMLLRRVLYQPEAASRGGSGSRGEAPAAVHRQRPARPLLTLVHGGCVWSSTPRGAPDDPGPSAA